MDIALATCLKLPEPDFDAAPLAEALGRAGLSARQLAWDDPNTDFGAARITLIRSTWNYPLVPEAFARWLEDVDAKSDLLNPLALARWNLHKGYLLELERRGVPIVPTEFLRARLDEESLKTLSLRSVRERRGWDDVVIKPAISAGSYLALRVRRGELERGNQHLRRLLAERDVLVQQFLPSVAAYGERSLIWIDGRYSHAVRKRARFHGDEESVSRAAGVSDREIRVAERALEVARWLAGAEPFYGRVDVAADPSGRPVLMELEMLEPSLFFELCEGSADRMAEALARRLHR